MKIIQIALLSFLTFVLGAILYKAVDLQVVRNFFKESSDAQFFSAALAPIGAFMFLSLKRLRKEELTDDIAEKPYEKLSNELKEVQKKIENLKVNAVIPKEEQQAIFSKFTSDYALHLVYSQFQKIEKENAERYSAERKYTAIRELIFTAINELRREIRVLKLRSIGHLSFGGVMGLFGFVILGVTLLRSNDIISLANVAAVADITALSDIRKSQGITSTTTLIVSTATRLSLIILSQTLAYFFLRLYRENINDIKYLLNEVTTLYLRLSGIEMAISYTSPENMGGVSKKLIIAERNFILRKGEAIATIKQNEIAEVADATAINALSSLLEKVIEKLK